MIIPDGRMDDKYHPGYDVLDMPQRRQSPILCLCGCDLGVHVPHIDHPFAWPCRNCKCNEFRENPTTSNTTIYILDPVGREETMVCVRVSRYGNRWKVFEGLTNR